MVPTYMGGPVVDRVAGLLLLCQRSRVPSRPRPFLHYQPAGDGNDVLDKCLRRCVESVPASLRVLLNHEPALHARGVSGEDDIVSPRVLFLFSVPSVNNNTPGFEIKRLLKEHSFVALVSAIVACTFILGIAIRWMERPSHSDENDFEYVNFPHSNL